MKVISIVMLVLVVVLMIVTSGVAAANFETGHRDLFRTNLICLGAQAAVGALQIFFLTR